MKKKLFLVALMISLCAIFTALFTVTAFADDGITVTYNWYSRGVRATATPNEDGSYTLRDTKFSGNATVTLTDGSVVDKEFFGWIDDEGNLYAPGATVTFTKSTRLYEAYGITVYNAEDLRAVLERSQTGPYVKLGADIEIDKQLWTERNTAVIDLNGHNITSTVDGYFIHVKRGAFVLRGEGTVTHTPATTNKDDRGFIRFEAHGYADENEPQLCWIGKGVTVNTPYHLLYVTNVKQGCKMPDMVIAGEVNAKSLARIDCELDFGRCYITEDAVVNLTTNFLDFRKQNGSYQYMTVTLNGKIKLDSSVIFTDFLLSNKFDITPITSGEYAISEADAKNLALMVPEALMLRAVTDENGVVWYKVVDADCAHEWELSAEESYSATLEASGLNVYYCQKCASKKQEIVIYQPTDTEITVVALIDGERKTYTVKAGDVIDFEIVGFGVSAICEIAGLKDTAEFTSAQVVELEIPAGVKFFSELASESLEKIVIADGADIEISDLSSIVNLKEIEIKAAKVIFKAIKSTTVEKITSNVSGADITFDKQSFSGKKNVTAIKMCAGSTYSFGENSFNQSGLTEVIFPDDSNINFTGGAAFYGSPNLKYAYFGRNCISDKKIWNKPFDCVYALEEVVLMDIVYIDQYVFCCNGSATSTADFREGKGGQTEPIRIYHHGDTLSINDNAFVNRAVIGVELYTLSGVSTLKNCAYTIYQGIAHPYYAATITESTCVTKGTAGYVTTCVCGMDYRETAYKTYSTLNAEINDVENAPCGSEIITLPLLDYHTESDILKDVFFENGYEKLGFRAYKCLYCDEISMVEDEASYPALFTNRGYSFSESGENGVNISVVMHVDVIEAYETLTGRAVEYGLFVTTQKILGENDIVDENGNVFSGVYAAKMPSREFSIMNLKLYGFDTDEQKNAKFTFGAYVIDGGKPSYIQEGEKLDGDKYVFTSYNQVKGKEEE